MAGEPFAVAVVGLGGRFPNARDPEAFWKLMMEGRDGVGEAPADRPWFRQLFASAPVRRGHLPSTRSGFLADIDKFDASFFHMSAREARRTDPQLRLLLEIAYETFQDAGVPSARLSGTRTGVFIGASSGDYWLRQVWNLDAIDIYAEVGAATRAALSGRLAYTFDLRGPALNVDTACSSSLAAVHLACCALRAGDCDSALAGGCNLILTPYTNVSLGAANLLSPDGRCKFGDVSADGAVRSEAVGLVLLKPLAPALADGDRVRAVILASAIDNGGRTGTGMFTPDRAAQTDVLRTAYRRARVDPRRVAFVEAHGTGTSVGDQVELNVLADVLGPRSNSDPRCVVGSAKTAIGHAEAAAGVVGLIKTVLALQHRTLPGNALLHEATRQVDWSTAPVRLATGPVTFPADGAPLIAGVSSFGGTGTNVHLVVSSAPLEPNASSRFPGTDRELLLALSGRSGPALTAVTRQYLNLLAAHLEDPHRICLVCAAAATRRDHFEYRAAFTAATAADLVAELERYLSDPPAPQPTPSRGEPPVDPNDLSADQLADLYHAGFDPDWTTVFGTLPEPIDLPHYPWQRQRYWYQADNCPWPAIGLPTATAPTAGGPPRELR